MNSISCRVLVILLVFSSAAVAQYSGFPIRNYSVSEYNASPQCWSVIQDTRGILYIGNSTYILEYDGKSFRKIYVQKSAPIRALGMDSNGRVYVGSVGNFGYLAHDNKGQTHFQSLLSLVPEASRAFSDIWEIHVIGDTVIFQSNEAVFLYDQKKITPVIHKYPFASISFKYENDFIVRVKSRGLHILKGNKLNPVSSTEEFASEPVFGIIDSKVQNDQLLVLSGTKGFYQLQKKCLNENIKNGLKKIRPPADSLIISSGVLGMSWLNDSVIAINSRKGLILLDKELNVKDIINKKSGLLDDAISSIFTDRNGQTWMTLNNGLAKVSLSSPFYFYTESAGFAGVLETVTRDGQYLYIATTSGIYYSLLKDTTFTRSSRNNNLKFSPVPEIEVEGWNFYKHKGKVYAATSNGVFMLQKGRGIKVSDTYTTKVKGGNHPDRLYFAQKDGLAVYHSDKKGNLQRYMFFPFPGDDILDILETPATKEKAGQLWLATRFRGVIRFNVPDEIDPVFQRYDTLNGLPEGNIKLVLNEGRIYFFHSLNGLIYDSSKDTGKRNDKCFFPAPGFEETGISYPLFWKFQFKRELTEEQLQEFTLFDKSISDITPENGGVYWLCVAEKLARFDGRFVRRVNFNYSTSIRSIKTKDSVLYYGGITTYPGINGSEPLVLPFKMNNLNFSFGADWYDHEEATYFRYKLNGFDTSWSQWSRDNFKEFTNLAEGSYVLQVQSQNLYSEPGKEATLTFVIEAPWYRSISAYGVYFLSFIGVILGSVRLSVSQLRRAKDKLENLVNERTAEVVKQKEIVEQKNQLLEFAYKDISDSISYASRIQQAILPTESQLLQSFNDYFILFLPRDVVSGDFYWHAKIGKTTFIAAADCTGHGVPGAFMSMIGNTLLNEIVVSKRISEPGVILQHLDAGVKNALKQFSGESDSNDGMDITLCAFSEDSRTLYYSGANRPLFIVNSTGLVEVKADKRPIGGAFYPNGAYTTHEKKLEPGDMVYLFSDGFADQFGGSDGKKFMLKRLKSILSDIASRACAEQHEHLLNELNTWKGGHSQIDDVLVVGFRV